VPVQLQPDAVQIGYGAVVFDQQNAQKRAPDRKKRDVLTISIFR
jgi:hypothetical protein